MEIIIPAVEDLAEGQLDSNISASATSIVLDTDGGDAFPATAHGTATSGGTATALNATGVGASGVAVGDFIRNITDGSHAIVLTVAANALTTTELRGGSDNTWQNNDEYASNSFVITLEKRTTSGGIVTVTQREKALVTYRTGDTLTVEDRGYDGTTAQEFDAADYVVINAESSIMNEQRKAFAEILNEIDGIYTKTEINALLAARNWKEEVRAATTAALTLATDLEDGDTLDGVVTLATGDRVLVKNQATASENGIYIVAASGAPTRATDFDGDEDVTGAVVPVTEGTVNADTLWICTSDNPEIGTDDVAFAAISPSTADFTLKSTLTTKGDLYVATGAATPARLGVGDDGTVPVADSAAASGVSYQSQHGLGYFGNLEGRHTYSLPGSFFTGAGGTADAATFTSLNDSTTKTTRSSQLSWYMVPTATLTISQIEWEGWIRVGGVAAADVDVHAGISAANAQEVAYNGDSGNDFIGFAIDGSASKIYAKSVAAGVEVTDCGAVANTTEYHLRIKATASEIKFYINGTLVATHTTQTPALKTTLEYLVFSEKEVAAVAGNHQVKTSSNFISIVATW